MDALSSLARSYQQRRAERFQRTLEESPEVLVIAVLVALAFTLLMVYLGHRRRHRIGAREPASTTRVSPPRVLPEPAARNLLQRFDNAEEALHRVALFAQIMDRYAATEAAREAIERGLDDPHPAVRLRAARHAEPKRAVAVARDIAFDNEGSTALRTEAVEVLELYARTWPDAAAALAELLATEPGTSVALAVLEMCLRRGIRLPAAVLEPFVSGEEGALGLAVAENLATAGGDPEPALIALLRHPVDEVRWLAVAGLKRRGTAAAVAPLRELARGGDRHQQAEIELAIAIIQARIGPTEAGALSLTGPDAAGRLTVSEGLSGERAPQPPPAEADHPPCHAETSPPVRSLLPVHRRSARSTRRC